MAALKCTTVEYGAEYVDITGIFRTDKSFVACWRILMLSQRAEVNTTGRERVQFGYIQLNAQGRRKILRIVLTRGGRYTIVPMVKPGLFA